MFLLLYAIFLIFFWVRASFWLKPERYPAANPTAIFNFRKYLLSLYARYAALFIISYFLALLNGWIAAHLGHDHEIIWGDWLFRILTILIAVFDIVVLIYILKNAIRNAKFFRQIKNTRS